MLYFSQVQLHFTESALRLIAKKAISKNTGARGLRALLETILMDAMYEVGPLLFSVAISACYYLEGIGVNNSTLESGEREM